LNTVSASSLAHKERAALTRKHIALLKSDTLRRPGALNTVVVLIVGDGDGLVDDVADCADLGLQGLLLLGGGGEQILLLLLQVGYGMSAFP